MQCVLITMEGYLTRSEHVNHVIEGSLGDSLEIIKIFSYLKNLRMRPSQRCIIICHLRQIMFSLGTYVGVRPA